MRGQEWTARLAGSPVLEPLQDLSALAAVYVPRALGALLVLLAGRLAAGILRRLTRDVLRATGFDVVLQRLGVAAVLERAGVRRRPSELCGGLVFWVLILFAVMAALEVVGLPGAAGLLRALVAFTPRLVVGAVLAGLGLWLADRAGRLVERAAEAGGIPAAGLWGQVTRWGVAGFAGVAILEELQVASQTLRLGLLGALAMGPVGAAIALGLGGQGLARELLAGQVVRSAFRPGDRLHLDVQGRPLQGRIERFELASVLLRREPPPGGSGEAARDEGDLVSVPYSYLAGGVVGVRRQRPQAPAPPGGAAGQPGQAGPPDGGGQPPPGGCR